VKDWLFYEKECISEGYNVICGVDEAGRGPLAGPVCAAAVILEKGKIIEGADDSKRLSERKREELFEIIKNEAIGYGVAFSDEKEIDTLNILNATYLAMKRAVNSLGVKPDIILVDGNKVPDFGIPAKPIVKGDANSMSIACASILAKVTRDRYMRKLDEKYPIYGFGQHKGYGTKLHIEKLKKFGSSPVHRKSFLKKIIG
jgi:Ribonuclease HII